MATGAPDKDKPMDEKYRKILRRVSVELVRDMNVRKVLRHMAAADVFTVEDEDIVKSKGSRQEQCETFLDILPTRGSKAYGSFIKALKEVQLFLAEVVIEAENKELNDELTSERQNSTGLQGKLRSLQRLLEAERKEKEKIEDRYKALTEKLRCEEGMITTNKDNKERERRQHELTDLNNNEKRSSSIITDVQGLGGEKFCPQCNDLNKKIIKSLTIEGELQKKINQLKEENKKLKEEKRRLTSKIKVIEKQISMDELKDVKAECDRLKREKEFFSSEMANLREKVDKLGSKNEKLEDEMTKSKTFVNCVLLPHGTDFRSSGVIGALKRNASAKLVATRSSDGPGKAADVLCHRNDKTCGTEEKKGSWWRIDLGENYLLFITHCALKNGRNDPVLRKWQLQGSTDGRDWTALRTERKQFEYPGFTATWSVEGKVEAFRYFQILQTGLNSSGKYGIFLSGVEFYGVLLEVRHGMSTLSKSSLES